MPNGRLEVVAGPMFSGKTETLIHRLGLAAKYACERTVAFKPVADTRHADSLIHSHSGHTIESRGLALDAPDLPTDVKVIGIDEGQFLMPDAVPRILEVVRAGARVIVAGLDLDAFGRPFGPMPVLMAFADDVVKLTSTCVKCRNPATRSHRLVRSDAAILVGGAETYEPRCVVCFDPKGGA